MLHKLVKDALHSTALPHGTSLREQWRLTLPSHSISQDCHKDWVDLGFPHREFEKSSHLLLSLRLIEASIVRTDVVTFRQEGRRRDQRNDKAAYSPHVFGVSSFFHVLVRAGEVDKEGVWRGLQGYWRLLCRNRTCWDWSSTFHLFRLPGIGIFTPKGATYSWLGAAYDYSFLLSCYVPGTCIFDLNECTLWWFNTLFSWLSTFSASIHIRRAVQKCIEVIEGI